MIIKPINLPGGALLPLATATFLSLAASLSAAPRFVMEIRDHEGSISIPGESDAPGHPGAIEVVSFGKGYTPEQGFPTVETTGIELGVITDQALPLLLNAVAHGNTLHQVDIFYLGNADKLIPEEAAHMRLEHVQVVEVTPGFGSDNPLGPAFENGPHVTHLTLNFSQVTWTYQQFDPNGGQTFADSSSYRAYENSEDPAFDDDNDGLHNDVDDDDDNDKIPDSHEKETGTNPTVDDGDADDDNDTQSNYGEWLAGTLANDAGSFFAISSLTIKQTKEGRVATVSFPIIADRHYRLVGTNNLALPRDQWPAFDSFDTDPDIPASDAEVVLNPEILPQLGQMFFAVEVRRPTP
jgi:type VI protein secretion system component Hcp